MLERQPVEMFDQKKDNSAEIEKYEKAIKGVIMEDIIASRNPDMDSEYDAVDVGVISPRQEDMRAIESGDFEISGFKKHGDDHFEFYVGKTEIHLKKDAAKKVMEISEGMK